MMHRGNNMRQPNIVSNTSRSQERGAGPLFASSNMLNLQHQKNKSGLPFIPSTPSTRSSHSGTSFGSHRINSFDEKDDIECETEQYDNDIKQRSPQKYWKEGVVDHNRGRFDSPNKRNDRSGHKGSYRNSNEGQTIYISGDSQNNTGEYHQSQQSPVFYVPSRSHPSNSPKVMSSNASQSTSSTTSSRRQLIPNVKSSSSISTFGSSTGTNGNHRQAAQHHHPDAVQEEQTDGYSDIDDETSLDEGDLEEDTLRTRPMIRYNNASRIQERENADALHSAPVHADGGDDASPFFNESFDTVDFGSTTGVAPAVPAPSMVVPKRFQGTNRQPERMYHTQNVLEYDNEQKGSYEYDDNGAYYEDEKLLYENSNDNYIPPEYDDEEYYDEGEEYYDDEVEQVAAEEVQLQRAVRRGSALAFTSGGYSTSTISNVNQHHGQYIAEQNQSVRPLSTRAETGNTSINPPKQMRQTQQQAVAAARRPQISRSMASKRHLIAASARGVVPTRVSSNVQMDSEVHPVPSKQRGIENGMQQQQQQSRQRAIKASGCGDAERPPPQQPSRGSVAKASSHNDSMQNPPPRNRSLPVRMSSNRGIGAFSTSESAQPATRQPPIRGASSSRRNTALEEETQRRPENQRGNVGKAASHNSIISQNQNAVRRNAVNKAASHNGYFESSLVGQSPPEIHQPQVHGPKGSSRRNKMDSFENPRNALPPSNQAPQRDAPPSSSRRRSLEHVPSQSFRSNTQDSRYTATNQHPYPSSQQNNDRDYDYEDDNNYLQPKMNISHRRMSAGYLPPASSNTKRAVARRGLSMDLTANDIVQNDDNENLHDVSFSDLAARRF